MPVAPSGSACIFNAVRKLTPAIAMIVLLLWGLAAMHCKLEGLPGLDFLKSCCMADTESPADSSNDCDDDSCASVEGGAYRAEDQVASAPQPHLVLALHITLLKAPRPEPTCKDVAHSTAPPDLPKVWQFTFRTALPPRPPSIAS